MKTCWWTQSRVLEYVSNLTIFVISRHKIQKSCIKLITELLSAKWWKSPDVRNPSQFYWQSNILLEFLKYEAKSTFTNWDFWLVTELNISVLMRQLGLFLSHLSFIEIQQKQKFPFVKSKSQQTVTKNIYVYHISYPFFWNQGLHNWSIVAMANELSS